MVRVARLELAASWSQTRRPTNWATPGYLLLLFAQSGQTCGQIPFSTAQSGLSVEIFPSAATAFLLSRETQHFPCSSSQTRRPTNWATPGYLLLLFAQSGQTCGQIPFSAAQGGLSMEISPSAATAFLLLRETQHFPCSSSQTRRPTNWATPGYAIARRRITAHPLFYTTAAGLSTTFV